MEIWRDIEGYENLYQVSNLGRVRSLKYNKEKILKPANNGGGYLKVGLSQNNKTKQYLVHRLVATAFIPNPNNLPVVNHKDEKHSNNSVDNLEWCTSEYNSTYGTRIERITKQTSKPIYSINITTHEIEYYQSASDAYRKTKIDRGDICNCCRGKYNSAGGYKWYYA